LNITGGVNDAAGTGTADSDDTFTNVATQKVSDRTTTTESVDWIGVPTASNNSTLTTPDLSSIVQEIVNGTDPGAGTWAAGEDMVFLINDDSGSSGRAIYDVSDAPTKAATLTIEYCDASMGGTIEQNWLGLRFQDVGIPQGAVINSATISFTADNPSQNVNTNGGVDDDVIIYGEDVDDSAPFTAGTQFSNRSLTTQKVDWEGEEMGTWVEDTKYVTNDLKNIVGEIVDRSGWCGGNDMSFLIQADPDATAGVDEIRRLVKSFDDDPSAAAVLTVKYDNVFSGADTGCNARSYSIPIAQPEHDARTKANSTQVNINSNGLPLAQPGNDFTIGLIFSLPVEKDTTIVSANIEFTANGNNASSAGTSNMLINAEAADNAANFAKSNKNLDPSKRARITGAGIPSGGIQWDQAPVGTDATFTSVDVAPLVSAVTSRTGWVKDNKMAFFITDGTTPLYRQAKSYDGDPANAPRLNITVQESTSTTTVKTVRERLLEINDTFTLDTLLGWTPSTGTLLEAAKYWRGKDVLYGKERGMANLAGRGTHSKVNGIDYRIKMERTTTSHPGSYTGGTYNDGAADGSGAGGGSDCEFETTRDCLHDYVSGAPNYISPIDTGLECSNNFQIFLTDGEPTQVPQSQIDEVISEFDDISSCSTSTPFVTNGNRGACSAEIAKSLHDNDQSTLHDGNQNVVTYTIAFNLNSTKALNWLDNISSLGGGTSYTATNATSLLNVFDQIFNDIVSRPTSFVAPSIAANSFNRLFSRDEVYFGMFLPSLDTRWEGNVKKYRICDDTDVDDDGTADCTLGDIMDNDNLTQAVVQAGAEEGLFETTSVSVWSALQGITSSDNLGREVVAGGAGGRLTDYTNRVIYTDVRDVSGSDDEADKDQSLGTAGFKITSATWDDADTRPAREAICPTAETNADVAADTTQCVDYMLWMLGKDVLDEDEDSSTTDTRWSFADVLHSSPVTATYGKTTGGDFIDKVFVGTNEGGLRMINGATGEEEWLFMPNSLMGNQATLYSNPEGSHTYGLDVSPVLRFNDINEDGVIDTSLGEYVHIYIAMRRGGNEIYALDVSPTAATSLTTTTSGQIVPKFLWKITGGAGDFVRLGDTWSEPVLSTIGTKVSGTDNTPDTVLIFGGGYDENLDDDGDAIDDNYGVLAGDPNLGNAIYIVDADTGALMVDISSDSSADINPAQMKHSIPSQIKVVDIDGDGLDDRLYVGDMGGQVWRVDLGGDITSGNAGSTVVGRLANVTDNGINGDTSADDGAYESLTSRRRFFVPPSIVQVSDDTYSTIQDYDYVLIPSGDRTNPLETTVKNRFYAFRDTTIGEMTAGSGSAKNLAVDYPRSGSVPIKDDGISDMIDISNVVTTGVGLDPTDSTHKASLGWYLDFDSTGTDGEKGLSLPTAVAGTVVFTTYVPETSGSGVCEAAEGSGRAFALDILAAGPALDWDGDGSTANDAGDVVQNLGSGIPSEAVPIFTEEGVTLLVGTGGGAENLGKVSDLPRYRTYWYQEDS
jgi:type IV pilus assembly protein PilY1